MRTRALTVFSICSLLFLGCAKESDEKKKEQNLAKKKVQLWQTKTGTGWQDFRKVTYTYNGDGLLMEEKAQRIVSEDSLVNQFRLLSNYDDKGRLMVRKREIWNGYDWEFAIQNTFTYKNDRIDQRKDSLILNGESLTSFISYAYNDKGLLQSETSQSAADNQNLGSVPKVDYKYNQQGLAIEKAYPVFKNNTWENARKMVLNYNDKGHHIETIRYNWKENDWQESVRYELEIDNNGNRLSELWTRPNPKGKQEFMQIIYSY